MVNRPDTAPHIDICRPEEVDAVYRTIRKKGAKNRLRVDLTRSRTRNSCMRLLQHRTCEDCRAAQSPASLQNSRGNPEMIAIRARLRQNLAFLGKERSQPTTSSSAIVTSHIC